MRRALVFVPALLALCLIPRAVRAQATARQVTGKVTRTLGETPVLGATIVEMGGKGVAQSGADGNFTINVGTGDVRLMVRAIGYQRKEVAVPASQASVTVALDEDPFKLEAVVVTGQATTIERRNATTAPVQVSSDELNRAPAEALEQALQGKVPGAIISMNSGAPGGGGQVQIRGITSMRGAGKGGAPQFNLSSRVGRSVVYRLLGTRTFETVSEVRTLPYGNGSGKADSAVLAQLYPSGTIPFTHDYQSEFYNSSKPSYEF